MEEENREGRPAQPPKPKADAIALLFLTVGEIRNSDIWAAWLKPVNPDLYSIYVHAKVRYLLVNSTGPHSSDSSDRIPRRSYIPALRKI